MIRHRARSDDLRRSQFLNQRQFRSGCPSPVPSAAGEMEARLDMATRTSTSATTPKLTLETPTISVRTPSTLPLNRELTISFRTRQPAQQLTIRSRCALQLVCQTARPYMPRQHPCRCPSRDPQVGWRRRRASHLLAERLSRHREVYDRSYCRPCIL
jgi:hypothetical protein